MRVVAAGYGRGELGVVEIAPPGPRLHVRLGGHTATMVIKADQLELVEGLEI